MLDGDRLFYAHTVKRSDAIAWNFVLFLLSRLPVVLNISFPILVTLCCCWWLKGTGTHSGTWYFLSPYHWSSFVKKKRFVKRRGALAVERIMNRGCHHTRYLYGHATVRSTQCLETCSRNSSASRFFKCQLFLWPQLHRFTASSWAELKPFHNKISYNFQRLQPTNMCALLWEHCQRCRGPVKTSTRISASTRPGLCYERNLRVPPAFQTSLGGNVAPTPWSLALALLLLQRIWRR